MKILLIADTHGYNLNIERVIQRHKDEIQMVCHLGDGVLDLFALKPKFPDLKMVGVAGNAYGKEADIEELVLELPLDKKALFIHGHQFRVKRGFESLTRYAKEKGVDACFFAHTHLPTIETRDGLFLMNPGSLGAPWGSGKTYGLVNVTDTGDISGCVERG